MEIKNIDNIPSIKKSPPTSSQSSSSCSDDDNNMNLNKDSLVKSEEEGSENENG